VVLDLLLLEHGVEWNHDATQLPARQRGQHELRDVLGHDGHPVAPFHPPLGEADGQSTGEGIHGGEIEHRSEIRNAGSPG
jgi:hypothetical protein